MLQSNTKYPLIDSNVVPSMPHELLAIEKAQRMADFFSFLGDANRLRILSFLSNKELCVSDLATLLEMSESAVSHQLRNLRAMRLVTYRKQGRNVFYSLHDNHIFHLYHAVAEHLDEKDE
jgi:DNA-binding transcriptional ArsR family regulator